MQINLENSDKNAIQSYSNTAIKINHTIYSQSLIVSSNEVNLIEISKLTQLENCLANFLHFQPEVILIGHQGSDLPPFTLIETLAKQRIGLEVMAIGAACRTFNVLLSEARKVVLGILITIA